MLRRSCEARRLLLLGLRRAWLPWLLGLARRLRGLAALPPGPALLLPSSPQRPQQPAGHLPNAPDHAAACSRPRSLSCPLVQLAGALALAGHCWRRW
jgi:hypothetical protein